MLDAAATRAALPVARVIDVMRDAMAAFASGDAYQPVRMVVQPPGIPGLGVLKPAHVGGSFDAFGFKSVTLFPGNADHGLDSVQGFVALLDPRTGVPLALLEGGVVTEVRTSAVSAVATDVLAHADAGDLALLGAGVQARGHLEAIAHVRDLRRVRVWNRTEKRARSLAEWGAERSLLIEVCDTPQAAVDGADLVCTVTSSPDPVLEGDWLAAGAHVNAVGAFTPDTREVDSEVVRRADVIVVDSRESMRAEAGDLLIPLEQGVLTEPFEPAELGEILTGARTGRASGDQITFYESLGLALQDVTAAAFAVGVAEAGGLGVEVAFP
ncbi:MAG TPA: ornithine cyclodeaminase family protein [Nitriliruptorales bacterium]